MPYSRASRCLPSDRGDCSAMKAIVLAMLCCREKKAKQIISTDSHGLLKVAVL